MLANAVSSAVERLYAAAPVEDERGAVPRVSAVAAIARLRPRGEGDGDGERDAGLREDRERVQGRQALTRGVLAVFEASTTADTLGTDAGSTSGDSTDRPTTEATMPDPQLEEAILRFIHTVFRSLAETDGSAGLAVAGQGGRPAAAKPAMPAESREALSTRIENLAQRLAAGTAVADADDTTEISGSAKDKPTDPTGGAAAAAATAPDAALQQAYAEVVQALHANLGDSARQSQTTRAELVSMMQRLALAMHGAPPIDPGLPTRGGLLSARA